MGYQVSQERGTAGKPVPGMILIRFGPLSIMGFSGLSGLWIRSLAPLYDPIREHPGEGPCLPAGRKSRAPAASLRLLRPGAPRPASKIGRAVSHSPSGGRQYSGGDAARRGLRRLRPPPRRGRGHPHQHRERGRAFGKEVAHIIEGLTKISKMKFSSAEEHQAENFRKMLMAMVDDLRIILVKLADRLHNMRTLQHLSEERRIHIANETLEIYAPLAGRLGIGKIKTELEDLCLKNLEPKAYGVLAARVEAKRKWTEEFIAEVKGVLEKNLAENGIPAEITGRTKSIYSIYQKMKRQQIELDQVYDFIALRIISDSVKNCYATLGIIHNTWRPGARPDQGLHRDAPAQRLPLAPYQRHHRRRRPLRGPDSNGGDAPGGRAGNRRPLEVQGRKTARRAGHPELRLAAADHRMAAGSQRPPRVPQQPQGRSLSRGRVLFHPQGGREVLPPGGDSRRLRLCHPYRRRPPVRRLPGQRAHGPASLQAQERGHRRDPHLPRPSAEPRLALVRRHLEGSRQDPGVPERRRAPAQHRDRHESSWRRSRSDSTSA